MRYDIVLVSYNSAQWLTKCVAAISAVNYEKKELKLIFIDNGSTDASISLLEELRTKYTEFGGFDVILNGKNSGFGAACNIGAKHGDSPYLFFLNVDTEVDTEVFNALDIVIKEHADAAAFECRQLPCETGHHIDPVTLKTSWASGAALVVKREVFATIGGFDKRLFMYCEDVDLSWRIRAAGHSILYVPSAKVIHYAYKNAQPKLGEYAHSFYGNLLLRYKYGDTHTIWQGEKMYLGALYHPRHFENVRRVLLKNYIRHFVKLWPFLFWRISNAKVLRAKTWHFENGFSADRGLCELHTSANTPLISVILRTYQKKDYLRLALTSLAHQTYNNMEIIVCEDGTDTASAMINQEFASLNVHYLCDGKRYGRAVNGNRGLACAKGEYCMFLDDDDLFYPDHVELFAAKASEYPNADLILGSSMAMFVNDEHCGDMPYTITSLEPMVFSRIDIFNMCQSCRIPIESALFKRQLYVEYGGLANGLNANEDWSMWLRYLAHAKRISHDTPDITRMTSLFLQPASPDKAAERLNSYKADDEAFFNDESLHFDVSVKDMRKFYKDTVADFEHLYRTGKLEAYFDEMRDKY